MWNDTSNHRSQGRFDETGPAGYVSACRPQDLTEQAKTKRSRFEARKIFEECYARTGDAKGAAEKAGVSERTGRRWQAKIRDDQRKQSKATLFPESAPLIGRQAEVSALTELVLHGPRIVTVFGPPGIGKTRLVQRAMSDLRTSGLPRFYCDFRQADSLDAFASEVGRALDAHALGSEGETTEATLEAVGRGLRARGECLVVLDNLEHLIERVVDTLRQWHDVAPGVRFVVTSRCVLALRGEHLFELAPLALPTTDQDDAEAWETESMRLFLDRASHVEPRFRTSATDTKAVRELVHRLEGIPLAIELAAGQMARTGPRELLDVLELRRLHLEHPARDVDGRHATLERAIDTSWRLLSEEERGTLASLSVFHGGFTIEAATHVVPAASGNEARVEPRIGELRSASMIRVADEADPTGAARWELFEAIREYAQARRTPTTTLRHRHAHFFLSWGERWTARLPTSAGATARLALARELPNLRAAFAYWRESRSFKEIGRMALVLWEAVRRWMPNLALVPLTAALEVTGSADVDLRSRLHLARAVVLRDLERRDEASRDFADARTSVDDDSLLSAEVDAEEAMSVIIRGSYDTAQRSLEMSLERVAGAGLEALRGRLHRRLARILIEGGHATNAIAHASNALAAANTLDNSCEAAIARIVLAVSHVFVGRAIDERQVRSDLNTLSAHRERAEESMGYNALGLYFQEADRLVEALATYRKAREVAAHAGFRLIEGVALWRLGGCLEEQGHRSEARVAYQRAIVLFERTASGRYLALTQIYLAGLEADTGNLMRSVSILDTAERSLATLGHTGLEGLCGLQRRRIDLLRSGSPRAAARHDSDSTLATSNPEARFILRQIDRGRTTVRTEHWTLYVSEEATEFQWDNRPPVSMPRGPVLPRVLSALVDARLQEPGSSVSFEALLRAGWPEEKMMHEAGLQRVYESIRRLRRLGLESAVKKTASGYLLDPSTPVVVRPPPKEANRG